MFILMSMSEKKTIRMITTEKKLQLCKDGFLGKYRALSSFLDEISHVTLVTNINKDIIHVLSLFTIP